MQGRTTPRDYVPVPTREEPTGGKSGPANDLEGFANIFGGHPILTCLLVFVPLGFAAAKMEMAPTWVFLFNFIAVIPLAWIIGKATEDVAAKLGETLGGLLNASFGNAVEMLICIAGIRNDEII